MYPYKLSGKNDDKSSCTEKSTQAAKSTQAEKLLKLKKRSG